MPTQVQVSTSAKALTDRRAAQYLRPTIDENDEINQITFIGLVSDKNHYRRPRLITEIT